MRAATAADRRTIPTTPSAAGGTTTPAPKAAIPGLLAEWLDSLDASGRFALLKLVTGGLRVGVSARLAKTALAEIGDADLARIEEIWHGLAPPYVELFAWLEGRAALPEINHRLGFRPLMLANPLGDDDPANLDPALYAAEWKWDGIRVQLAAGGGEARIYARGGDDIGQAFPDIAEQLTFDAVLDGELLVVRDGETAPFNDLQQRLGRKTVSKALMARYPAHVRLYDILFEGEEDLRAFPWSERRRRLEAWFEHNRPARMDLSEPIPFEDWKDLARLRSEARDNRIEGIMLKRSDSAYLAGRPKGPWFKWKRDPLVADCVLMYAQRGHGRRSSFYSDYTFGCWRDDDSGTPQLVPVGKAYFGFSDAELLDLDKWVRAHTTDRFGPVRAVKPGLVLEIAFDSIHPSPPTQIRRRHALSPRPPHPLGQACLGGRSSLRTYHLDRLRNRSTGTVSG